jgi:hypothetical protein
MSCKYSCKICLKLFKSNYHLQRHMNRKRPCLKNNFEISNLDNYPKLSKVIQNYPKLSKNIPSIIQNDIINSIDNKNTIKTTYKCKYCCKIYKYKSGISKHINTLRCKEIPQKVVKNIINTCKNKEIVIKKTKIEESNNLSIIPNNNSSNNNNNSSNNNSLNNTNSNNTNNTNNTINNNNIHININPFGKENLKNITKEEKIKTLNQMFLAFPKALEIIHYRNPENTNFFLANKNNKNFITLYNGEGFIYEHSNKFKDKLCNNIMEQLEDWFNEYKSKLLKNKKKILKQVFEEFYGGQLDKKYYKEIDRYLLTYSDNIKTILKDTIIKVKENNIELLNNKLNTYKL